MSDKSKLFLLISIPNIINTKLLELLGLTICWGITPRLDSNGSKIRCASNNRSESYLGNILKRNESDSAKSADDWLSDVRGTFFDSDVRNGPLRSR